jgi:hypothetical protein
MDQVSTGTPPPLLVLIHHFTDTRIVHRNIDWHNGVNLWTSALRFVSLNPALRNPERVMLKPRVNSGNPKFWLGLAHAKGEEGPTGLEEVCSFVLVPRVTCDCTQVTSAGDRFLVYCCGPSGNICGSVLQFGQQRIPGLIICFNSAFNAHSIAPQVGRLREAKQALSTAILLVPEHAGAYSNLGSTL